MKKYLEEFKLNKGLSPIDSPLRNSNFLSTMTGCFCEEGLIKVHETILTQLPPVACVFPYPQVFIGKSKTVVCLKDQIWEMVGGTLIKKIDGLTVNLPWSIADFFDYLVFSNGSQTVVRNTQSGVYTVSTSPFVPTANSCLNLQGQLIMGGVLI